MAPGSGIKAPIPRTRTGCLTCRKRKVKCDEAKPFCNRCTRLQRHCVWSDEVQLFTARSCDRRSSQFYSASSSSPNNVVDVVDLDVDAAAAASASSPTQALELSRPPGQRFRIEFPTIDRATIPLLRHFVTFCCRFLAFSNDSEGNPFQEALVPLAVKSPALLHSAAAVAAGHLARAQGKGHLVAQNHYATALRELNATLSDPELARCDSTLGACLLLCVYEISHSKSLLWHDHLRGARDLILYRGGPKTNDYLTRFFSFLDVSGSLTAGCATLLEGNYWLDDKAVPKNVNTPRSDTPSWPAYDPEGVMTNHFQSLMIFMAQLSRLSAQSMKEGVDLDCIKNEASQIYNDLSRWWQSCPPALRDQSNDWRELIRPRKLTVAETLEEEAFSSTKSCMYGSVLYLHHILDPMGLELQQPEVTQAMSQILDIAQKIPEGHGLEMGHYWGLFMVGITVFNDEAIEGFLRVKLKSDTRVSVYHADRVLELLEILWGRQHRYGCKYDWRQVQSQMGIQIFILV